ncbi:prepilin peptidase [Micromonospora sp. NPDC050397]|uniref:prepilin peptidase n=1 Tax=Micromonospora sp. NPDC050397 TaxID=3364279 RepID=UPI00384C0A5D
MATIGTRMNLWVAGLAAGLGIAAGPLLRVQAFRYSVASGPAREIECPSCNGRIAGVGVSWRTLAGLWSGRCRWCKLVAGPPRASVEVAAALSLGIIATVVDEALPLLAYCWVALVGLILAIVDLAVHRLPDRLTALLAAGVLAALGAQCLSTGEAHRLLEALAACAGAAMFYFLMSALTGGGIGLGDAKLAFGLGITVGWAGWPAVAVATFLGLVLTGLGALVLLLLRRAGRKDAIPHGPFMVLAALATIVVAALTGVPSGGG